MLFINCPSELKILSRFILGKKGYMRVAWCQLKNGGEGGRREQTCCPAFSWAPALCRGLSIPLKATSFLNKIAPALLITTVSWNSWLFSFSHRSFMLKEPQSNQRGLRISLGQYTPLIFLAVVPIREFWGKNVFLPLVPMDIILFFFLFYK